MTWWYCLLRPLPPEIHPQKESRVVERLRCQQWYLIGTFVVVVVVVVVLVVVVIHEMFPSLSSPVLSDHQKGHYQVWLVQYYPTNQHP